ncbi:MAG: hypothetical protein ABL961_10480, partial [Vicinamibacterales bacterium]
HDCGACAPQSWFAYLVLSIPHPDILNVRRRARLAPHRGLWGGGVVGLRLVTICYLDFRRSGV